MTNEQFSRLARETYGHRSWALSIATVQRVHRSTVYRWAEGTIPIPDDVPGWLRREAARKAEKLQTLAAG